MSPVPTPTTSLALEEINPGSFDFWLRDDVDGALARLRRERPIAWHQHPDSGRGFWSLTRFDDIAAASRDWETFSSAYGIQVLTDPEDTDRIGIRSMISTDPPKHTKLRSIVNRGFTPRMVAKAEDSVRRRAREIVDTIAPKGKVEFVSEVSAALPVAIICDMVGVPEADRPRLLDLTNRLLAGGDAEYGGTKESLMQAGHELRDYGLWLGKSRLEHPQEDIATTLVHAELDGEALPPEDLGPFILLLIAAGNETTRNAISHGLWALTQFPDEKRRWLRDLEGQEIAMWYISANRDEAHFTDPYRFDITRAANHQGGFGTGGAHFCLGAHLARREVVVMMTELLRRIPDIEAAGKPEKLRSNFVHGIKRLPAVFKPR